MVRQDKQKRPDRKQNYDQAGCAPDRTRTCNLGIRRPLLYPLSYGGTASDQPQRLRRRNPSLPAPGVNSQRCHLRAPVRADRVQINPASSIIHHRRRARCTQAPRTQKQSARGHPPRHFPHTTKTTITLSQAQESGYGKGPAHKHRASTAGSRIRPRHPADRSCMPLPNDAGYEPHGQQP